MQRLEELMDCISYTTDQGIAAKVAVSSNGHVLAQGRFCSIAVQLRRPCSRDLSLYFTSESSWLGAFIVHNQVWIP